MKKVCLFFILTLFTFQAAVFADLSASGSMDFRKIITKAKESVYPALVYIKPIVEDYGSGEKQKREVFGSGVIISPDGYIVTNNHVVKDARRINCVLYDKYQYSAEVIGKDPETDLALLKLNVSEGKVFPYASFGDSEKLKEGDFVMALGSPFGFTRSISLGIISNTRRYIGFQTQYKYNLWLQTDAAINPGNSGGPLVNTNGEIIGINTIGVFRADNIGFAIPSNIAKPVIEQLREFGEFRRAWTGIEIQALNDFSLNTFIESKEGVFIAGVLEGSPADAAGLRKGDILLESNGKDLTCLYVEDIPRVRWFLAELSVNEEVLFKVLRAGEILTLPLFPIYKGETEGDDFECRRWNMTLKTINRFSEPRLYRYRQRGVFIQGIKYSGNADAAGLRKDDIIVSIDGREIEILEDLEKIYTEIIKDENREKRVRIEIIRNGYKDWKVLDYFKDHDKE